MMDVKAKCGDRCSKLRSEACKVVRRVIGLRSVGFRNVKADEALVEHEVYIHPGVCRGCRYVTYHTSARINLGLRRHRKRTEEFSPIPSRDPEKLLFASGVVR